MFMIIPEFGQYSIIKRTSSGFQNLVDWTDSDLIKSTNEFNKLKLVAKDGAAHFFINGSRVDTIVTNTDGNIGPVAYGLDGPNVNGHFDNFSLQEIP